MNIVGKLKEQSLPEIISEWYKGLDKSVKIAAVVTFFVTVICNMYVFTNRWINHDDLMGDFKTTTMANYLRGGKWMQYYFKIIGTEFGAPVIHGILSAIILALTAVCLIGIFKIKSSVWVVLLSCILGTFPLNACYFGYMSSADIYYFALVTAVLSVWFVERNTIWGYIIGGISLMISLATYQSYLSIAVGLIVIFYYVGLMKEDVNLKEWFLKGLRDTSMVFYAFFLYQIVTKLLLKKYGVELQAYANEDQLFVFTPSAVVDSIILGIRNFGSWMYTTNKVNYQGWANANIVLTAVIAVLAIYRFFTCLKKKKVLQAILIAVISAILPIMLNNIYIIMNGRGWIHALTHYCLILIYILVVVMLEHTTTFYEKMKPLLKNCIMTAGALGLVVIVYFGFIITNQLYTRMNSNMNAVNSELTMVMARVSAIEGYTADTPVYFANCNSLFADTIKPLDIYDEKIYSGTWTGTDIYPWCDASHICKYLREYLYITVANTSIDKAVEIEESEEFAEMGVFPAENSVKMIDGVVVVKMGYDAEDIQTEDTIVNE